jgi:hypothetical protein
MKPKKTAIRILAFLFCVAVVVDTIPESYSWASRLKSWVHPALIPLGLSQGDWPLFAPNPVLNNGVLVAELTDRVGNTATWTSTDWQAASVWTKFYRFRHMNYQQRLPNNQAAAKDFADYLLRAVPDRERAQGNARWSQDGQMLEPAPIEPPMREVKLYKYRNTMVLEDGKPLPRFDETPWSTQINFIVRRESEP